MIHGALTAQLWPSNATIDDAEHGVVLKEARRP
jgi:hypothetical protein